MAHTTQKMKHPTNTLDTCEECYWNRIRIAIGILRVYQSSEKETINEQGVVNTKELCVLRFCFSIRRPTFIEKKRKEYKAIKIKNFKKQ